MSGRDNQRVCGSDCPCECGAKYRFLCALVVVVSSLNKDTHIIVNYGDLNFASQIYEKRLIKI